MALIVDQEIQMAKFSRTVGPDKNYDIPGRTKQYHGMYIGYVKSNTDGSFPVLMAETPTSTLSGKMTSTFFSSSHFSPSWLIAGFT